MFQVCIPGSRCNLFASGLRAILYAILLLDYYGPSVRSTKLIGVPPPRYILNESGCASHIIGSLKVSRWGNGIHLSVLADISLTQRSEAKYPLASKISNWRLDFLSRCLWTAGQRHITIACNP